MANETSTARYLIGLPDNQKPFALCLFIIIWMAAALKFKDDKIDSQASRIEILNDRNLQLQKDGEIQKIAFKEDKYNAVMKAKEDCEKEKQYIHKEYNDYGNKVDTYLKKN